MSPVAIVGSTAVAVAVIGWLVVSFSAPGRRRTLAEWVSTSAIYLALASLFGQLFHRAWLADSTAGLIGFGLLLLIFSGGLVLSLSYTLLQVRDSEASRPDVIT